MCSLGSDMIVCINVTSASCRCLIKVGSRVPSNFRPGSLSPKSGNDFFNWTLANQNASFKYRRVTKCWKERACLIIYFSDVAYFTVEAIKLAIPTTRCKFATLVTNNKFEALQSTAIWQNMYKTVKKLLMRWIISDQLGLIVIGLKVSLRTVFFLPLSSTSE